MDIAQVTRDLVTLGQVVMIDVALAGDNAVVVGMAVSGLPVRQRHKAILLGIGTAAAIRIALGVVALQLLALLGLMLAGGALLLWVCWRMFRELSRTRQTSRTKAEAKPMTQVMLQIALADLSMSLDNVLAVAGAAQGNPWILAVGLLLSVVLMGLAATMIARMLERWPWIAWIGLLIVVYVAVQMIWRGARQVAVAVTG